MADPFRDQLPLSRAASGPEEKQPPHPAAWVISSMGYAPCRRCRRILPSLFDYPTISCLLYFGSSRFYRALLQENVQPLPALPMESEHRARQSRRSLRTHEGLEAGLRPCDARRDGALRLQSRGGSIGENPVRTIFAILADGMEGQRTCQWAFRIAAFRLSPRLR